MEVVDHEPQAWFLFRNDEALLLDVNCSHVAAGYSVLIPLNPEELAEYSQEGRAFLSRLARSVQDSGPRSQLQLRDVTAEHSQDCGAALAEWRTANK